jgi:hypothetical protein
VPGLADGGYWNSAQIGRLREQGLQPIVPTKSAGRTRPRTLSPRQGPEAQRIDRLLDTPDGAALYRRRQQLIEPVFAQTKFLRRTDRRDHGLIGPGAAPILPATAAYKRHSPFTRALRNTLLW